MRKQGGEVELVDPGMAGGIDETALLKAEFVQDVGLPPAAGKPWQDSGEKGRKAGGQGP